MTAAASARAAGRYVTGLRRFLREPIDPAGASERIEAALARREESFLRLLERGVYGFPRGPYARLLSHLGVEYGDVESLVRVRGLEAANSLPWGLAAYLYSGDPERARGIAAGLEFGVVGVNDPLPAAPHLPFGGLKRSGLGKEGGRMGIEEFLETQLVSVVGG